MRAIRKDALEWWDNLDETFQRILWATYHPALPIDSPTGFLIEKIYKTEVLWKD